MLQERLHLTDLLSHISIMAELTLAPLRHNAETNVPQYYFTETGSDHELDVSKDHSPFQFLNFFSQFDDPPAAVLLYYEQTRVTLFSCKEYMKSPCPH